MSRGEPAGKEVEKQNKRRKPAKEDCLPWEPQLRMPLVKLPYANGCRMSGSQKPPETENPGIHIEMSPKRILRGAVVDVQEGAR